MNPASLHPERKAGARSREPDKTASKPIRFQEWSQSLNIPFDPYRAVIERVADGDAVHVIVSPGSTSTSTGFAVECA